MGTTQVAASRLNIGEFCTARRRIWTAVSRDIIKKGGLHELNQLDQVQPRESLDDWNDTNVSMHVSTETRHVHRIPMCVLTEVKFCSSGASL